MMQGIPQNNCDSVSRHGPATVRGRCQAWCWVSNHRTTSRWAPSASRLDAGPHKGSHLTQTVLPAPQLGCRTSGPLFLHCTWYCFWPLTTRQPSIRMGTPTESDVHVTRTTFPSSSYCGVSPSSSKVPGLSRAAAATFSTTRLGPKPGRWTFRSPTHPHQLSSERPSFPAGFPT